MRLVIIGAVAAGMSAASKAKRTAPQVDVRVFGLEEHVSYAACALPYYIGGIVSQQEHLYARTQEQFQEQGIVVSTGHEVTKILPNERHILVRSSQGEEISVSYDKLIICTGARPIIPDIPGTSLEGVYPVNTIPQSEAIRSAIAAGARRAVIIGAGYIGLEMAEALQQKGLAVTLLQRSRHIAAAIDPDMAALLKGHLEAKGMQVLTDVEAKEIAGDDRVQEVVTNRGPIPSDLVIVAAGVQPNSELAREAGIELGVKGAIQVNKRMETNIPDIYAAGDCATAWHELYQDDVYIPLGTTANKQGRIAGENAVGGSAQFSGVIGTAIMKVMDLGVGRTGLSSREAEKLGLNLLSIRVEVNNRAGYYPQSGKGTVKLLFDGEGRIWGAQMLGPDNFAKRIDVFAAAIQSRCTLEQLAGLDLSYAPPYSPVWDPVLVAANVALGKLK